MRVSHIECLLRLETIHCWNFDKRGDGCSQIQYLDEE